MNFMDGIRRLIFGEPEMEEDVKGSEDLVDTAPLPQDVVEDAEGDLRRSGYDAGSAQAMGHQREENEDALLALTASEIGEDSIPGFGLFCVADGAGGHGHGELASELAIKSVTRYLLKEHFLSLLDPTQKSDAQSIKEIMHRAFKHADSTVNSNAQGGQTTLTTVLLLGNQLIIGHVGDTRAYVIKNDKIELTTRDHSVPWRLVEIGQLTAEEARDHPQRNLLWNAVGKGNNLFIDVFTCPVPSGGSLLLCSDGLWSEVPDEELHQIVSSAGNPSVACEAMVNRANEAGGSDNITAVLISFSSDYGRDSILQSEDYFPSTTQSSY
jgi:serine/threonine protein phosphatase PrpC